jgi:Glycosyl hydrolase family 115/S-layer like family, C-terminal region
MNKKVLIAMVCFIAFVKGNGQMVTGFSAANTFSIADAVIYIDDHEEALIKKSASLFQQDIELVIGKKLLISSAPNITAKTIIIIGSPENSALIKKLVEQKKLNTGSIKNKWEAYHIQSIKNPFKGIENALVITGSDRRGIAYGVAELSKQIGVSPWYWWADVPVTKKSNLFIKQNFLLTDAPKVKYRGIFINDEAPALSNWSKEKFMKRYLS